MIGGQSEEIFEKNIKMFLNFNFYKINSDKIFVKYISLLK